MTQVRPRRSVLYMPGSNARALEKAKTLPADGIVLDLEDAVAPEVKVATRATLVATVKAGGYGRREVVVRVNGLDTEWGEADIREIGAAGPDALLVPKVNAADDIARIEKLMASAPAKVKLWVMIETPLAVLAVREIAAMARKSGSRLSCFVIGTNDLVKDTRATLDANRTAALFWLSSTVTAARAYEIDVLDGVFNAFKDKEGFLAECRHGRMLGMDGKTLIHPDQIAGANEIFSPPAAEVAEARKIIAAFEEPQNKGLAVIKLDGRMVEILHRDMARRTVTIADAIAAMGSTG